MQAKPNYEPFPREPKRFQDKASGLSATIRYSLVSLVENFSLNFSYVARWVVFRIFDVQFPETDVVTNQNAWSVERILSQTFTFYLTVRTAVLLMDSMSYAELNPVWAQQVMLPE